MYILYKPTHLNLAESVLAFRVGPYTNPFTGNHYWRLNKPEVWVQSQDNLISSNWKLRGDLCRKFKEVLKMVFPILVHVIQFLFIASSIVLPGELIWSFSLVISFWMSCSLLSFWNVCPAIFRSLQLHSLLLQDTSLSLPVTVSLLWIGAGEWGNHGGLSRGTQACQVGIMPSRDHAK